LPCPFILVDPKLVGDLEPARDSPHPILLVRQLRGARQRFLLPAAAQAHVCGAIGAPDSSPRGLRDAICALSVVYSLPRRPCFVAPRLNAAKDSMDLVGKIDVLGRTLHELVNKYEFDRIVVEVILIHNTREGMVRRVENRENRGPIHSSSHQ
jgi:hypothetical protein